MLVQKAQFTTGSFQRVGSTSIIRWGQEYTFEGADATVKNYLENLSFKDRPKKA
jgi:hypothetical protein